MLFDPQKMLLLAGPCSLESMETCLPVAECLTGLQEKHPELKIVFKGSFDKANRTSIESERGSGIESGLEILSELNNRFGFPLVTDIHESCQAEIVARVVDVIQIPAFLCRQTDLLIAAAKTGKVVNVKKGQFLAPQDMQHVAKKLEHSGASEIWLTERGATFGYRNLVVDMRGFSIMKAIGHPTIFDATHSVQLPSGGDGKSDGQREFVLPLARAALAAGANGIFLETHPNPDRALSDGPNMVPLDELPGVVDQLVRIWRLMKSLATE
ncbi:MAG: 3-deoxy-8-phosphooctulonate synthase [Verrucomicrobia bacterium]|nr:3-deoxy-8-phosphooctulonate synthase [Verrucomicrobiota bacterium]